MRLRVLLTNGSRTIDLVWLEHTGTDIYYGFVGGSAKSTYHASGARHGRDADGKLQKYSDHKPLKDFTGQMHLSTFGFAREIVESEARTQFTGKKSDAVLYLDSRTLPNQVNVIIGIVESGNYGALLPVHALGGLSQLSLITSVDPWIYVMVADPEIIRTTLADLVE